MELEFKSDFEHAQDLWDKFWKEELDTPLIGAEVPKPGVVPAEKPSYASGADGNFEPVIDQLMKWAETHEFLGAAIPFFYLEFAADHFASFLGADLTFPEGQQGGWAVPFLEDLDDTEIKFRSESKWWEQTVKFAEALRKRFDGKLLIASNTLVANLDALAAIRGSESLLVDMIANPEAVHRGLNQITNAYEDILNALSELLDYHMYGSINRHGMYCRGRINVPQSDISCMISPDMFAEFVIPYLKKEMDLLDAVEYHLDGPGAVQHLEALCQLDKLDIVQWVAGAGEPSAQDWSWLYQKIDSLGKGQIRGGTCDHIREIAESCSTKKLFCRLNAGSADEAKTCLEYFGLTA